LARNYKIGSSILFQRKDILMAEIKKVAMLTAGGLAPCLSSAVGGLIERFTEIAPQVEIIGYRSGFKGLLLGDSIPVTAEVRAQASAMHYYGGSPIGNSRVKLTNVEDCVERGYVQKGQKPVQVAADQLVKDNVDVLFTIGGDDTQSAAADLAAFLKAKNYDLGVVGLPKTIDNDVIPIKQSLGAWTAAEEGAKFFSNVVSEYSASPRSLTIHEVMGRHCGWLTAATAAQYRTLLSRRPYVPGFDLTESRYDVHAVFVPEMKIDIAAEAARLKKILDEIDCVNIFFSEGAGVKEVVAEMEANGEEVPRDAFGHVRLNDINPGVWFGKQFADMLEAEKVQVFKSGYFSRSASPNVDDIRLIKGCVDLGVECALKGEWGVIGHDEGNGNALRAIEFERVRGGKAFDTNATWFGQLLKDIGQTKGARVEAE